MPSKQANTKLRGRFRTIDQVEAMALLAAPDTEMAAIHSQGNLEAMHSQREALSACIINCLTQGFEGIKALSHMALKHLARESTQAVLYAVYIQSIEHLLSMFATTRNSL